MDLDYVAWDVWPPVFLEATVVCMGELSSGGEEACSRIQVRDLQFKGILKVTA